MGPVKGDVWCAYSPPPAGVLIMQDLALMGEFQLHIGFFASPSPKQVKGPIDQLGSSPALRCTLQSMLCPGLHCVAHHCVVTEA
jgi:hypothetical protein